MKTLQNLLVNMANKMLEETNKPGGANFDSSAIVIAVAIFYLAEVI